MVKDRDRGPDVRATIGLVAGRTSSGIDEIDRRILGVLVEDGRISVNELATRAGVSRATAYARFDRLLADGVVTAFRAELDPAAVGRDVTAMVLVNVEQGQWPSLRADLIQLPGVEYVGLTSGGFDFILIVRCPDIRALRDVVLLRLQGMEAVRNSQTVFVLDEQRRQSFLDRFPDAGPITPRP